MLPPVWVAMETLILGCQERRPDNAAVRNHAAGSTAERGTRPSCVCLSSELSLQAPRQKGEREATLVRPRDDPGACRYWSDARADKLSVRPSIRQCRSHRRCTSFGSRGTSLSGTGCSPSNTSAGSALAGSACAFDPLNLPTSNASASDPVGASSTGSAVGARTRSSVDPEIPVRVPTRRCKLRTPPHRHLRHRPLPPPARRALSRYNRQLGPPVWRMCSAASRLADVNGEFGRAVPRGGVKEPLKPSCAFLLLGRVFLQNPETAYCERAAPSARPVTERGCLRSRPGRTQPAKKAFGASKRCDPAPADISRSLSSASASRRPDGSYERTFPVPARVDGKTSFRHFPCARKHLWCRTNTPDSL